MRKALNTEEIALLTRITLVLSNGIQITSELNLGSSSPNLRNLETHS